MFKSIQICLQPLLGHSTFFQFCKKHIIIMDSLSSCRNLKTTEQEIEAERKSLIFRIVHRIKRALLGRIIGNKNKITSPFFFCILSDQMLFLRLQIERIADTAVIFFRDKLLDLIETYSRNLIYIRKFHSQNLQFLCIFFFQKLHRILKETCFHCHDILKAVNIPHLIVQTGVFIQMPLRIVLLRAEYRSGFKYPVKYTDHHLFIELWALLQNCRSVEIIQPEQVRTSLCSFCSDLRSMNFGKPLFIQKFAETSYDSFLYFKFCPLSYISQ